MAQKRGIVLHACHCGWGDIWEWAAGLGVNHWRIGQDISDDFNYPGNREKYYFDVLDQLDRGVGLGEATPGPGHWNDYDMLIVGLDGKSKQLVGTGASNIEYRTHFSLWAMVSSPMLVGADVRKLDAYSLRDADQQGDPRAEPGSGRQRRAARCGTTATSKCLRKSSPTAVMQCCCSIAVRRRRT